MRCNALFSCSVTLSFQARSQLFLTKELLQVSLVLTVKSAQNSGVSQVSYAGLCFQSTEDDTKTLRDTLKQTLKPESEYYWYLTMGMLRTITLY